ncbi:MAG: DUF1624 domain-containing protein [Victivallaceae bacterium]|nr:DUF1624 domain-containing protein [Victivallaceae bacterium]
MLKNLFATAEVNTHRQIEIDFVKSVLILLMILTHCFEYLSTPEVQAGNWYYFVVTVVNNFLGGSACAYMMCMGIGIAYSRKHVPEKFIRRGLLLFLGGYALNVIRFGIPGVLLHLAGRMSLSNVASDALAPDIMQFAGLAMMLFGLLKKARLSDWSIFGLALLMSVSGSFFRFIPVKNWLVSTFAGLFVGTINEQYLDGASGVFPLLNWFLIVIAGYLYGKALRRCNDLERYYAVVTPISGAIVLVYLMIAVPYRLGLMQGDIFIFYHISTPNVVLHFFNLVFLTGLYHFAAKAFSDGLKNRISVVSNNLNTIYWIQWIIVGWTYLAIYWSGLERLGVLGLFSAGALVFCGSVFIAGRLRKARTA